MKYVEKVSNNGKTIIIVNLKGAKPTELPEILTEAKTVIMAAPLKSALYAVDATNFTFNKESAPLLKTYSEQIMPYVKATCVVGADALRAVLLASVALYIKKDIKNFGTRAEAINWLSEQ